MYAKPIITSKLESADYSVSFSSLSHAGSFVLLKLDVVSAAVGILLHLEVVCGEAEGAEYHVAELLQVLHHLGLELFVALLYHGGKAPRRFVRLQVAGIELQHFLVVG